ncbi:hypothetical protein HMPREF0577_2258 [Mobiluncus mulieris ATCC 35243]|nr:hypothetical protein HMPREF0577_2258 [Mobiluncus mulieris ATCC 35243]
MCLILGFLWYCNTISGFPQAAVARGRSPHIGAVACGDVKKGHDWPF